MTGIWLWMACAWFTIRINSIKESPHHIMIGVIVNMKDKGPLIFINTVNSQVDEIPQQKDI